MIIKKYSNRRLYDTEASRYITLEELAARIRHGSDVQVIDAQNGDDLTQATLAQILLEGRGGALLLTVPVLVQLIRMQDDALAEFFGRYVTWALEVYTRAKVASSTVSKWNPWVGGALAQLGRFGPSMPFWQEGASAWQPQRGHPAGPEAYRPAAYAEPPPEAPETWQPPWPAAEPPPGYPPGQQGYPPSQAPSQQGYAAEAQGYPAPPPVAPASVPAADRQDDFAALRQELAALRAEMTQSKRPAAARTPRKKT